MPTIRNLSDTNQVLPVRGSDAVELRPGEAKSAAFDPADPFVAAKLSALLVEIVPDAEAAPAADEKPPTPASGKKAEKDAAAAASAGADAK